MFRTFRIILIAALFIALLTVPVWANSADKVNQMMNPSVTVEGASNTGSGTAVHVDDNLGTYIVTNWHVVKRQMNTLTVQFYGEEAKHPAYIHSYDEKNDIAVLITRKKATHLATLGTGAYLFEPVYCIGAPLGTSLTPTKGEIGGINYEPKGLEGRLMYRTSCDIISGNSGGGLYALRFGHWVYIGMPSNIRMIPAGGYGARQLVTYMGVSVRAVDIIDHLSKNNVPYVLYETAP